MKGHFPITNSAEEVASGEAHSFAEQLFKQFCDHLETDLCKAVGVDLNLYRNKTESDERSFAE